MFKKFVLIVSLSFLCNASAYAAAAGDSIEWNTANSKLHSACGVFQEALSDLSSYAFYPDRELVRTLCRLTNQKHYVSSETAFDTKVQELQERISYYLEKAIEFIPADHAQKIINVFKNIAAEYKTTLRELSPERREIEATFIHLLPTEDVAEDSIKGTYILREGDLYPYLHWHLPSQLVTPDIRAAFIRAINLASQLDAKVPALERKTTMLNIMLIGMDYDIQWAINAFVANKMGITDYGTPQTVHPLFLELLNRYSQDRSVEDLKPAIREAFPNNLRDDHYEPKPYPPFVLGDISRAEILQRERDNQRYRALLEQQEAREADKARIRAEEAEAEARRAEEALVAAATTAAVEQERTAQELRALEAARAAVRAREEEAARKRAEIDAILAPIEPAIAVARASSGWGGHEAIMAYGLFADRQMDGGAAAPKWIDHLTTQVDSLLAARDITIPPMHDTTSIVLAISPWIQERLRDPSLLALGREANSISDGVWHAHRELAGGRAWGPTAPVENLRLINALHKFKALQEKYPDKDMSLLLAQVFSHMKEHNGRCPTGARGRAFEIYRIILGFLRDNV